MAVAIQHDDLQDPTLILAHRYVFLLSQQKTLKQELSELRERLTEEVDDRGEDDENGHRILEFGRTIGDYSGLQRQRRVTRCLDEEAAIALLEDKGLLERCGSHVFELDHDEIMACIAEELLSEEDLDLMFPPEISYALCTVKA